MKVWDRKGKTIYTIGITSVVTQEYFGDPLKCKSTVLLQNCQLISEETQNTNKQALFASSMLFCSAEFNKVASPVPPCNGPADSFRGCPQGSKPPYIREKSKANIGGEFRWESIRQQKTKGLGHWC
jgi:hypothetical protein